MKLVVTRCDYNFCRLLWLRSSAFHSFPYLLNQITISPHGECPRKITMDRFNDFVIFIQCKIRLWYLLKLIMMIYFILLFCTTFPLVIVLVIFVLTWKSLRGTNKGSRPSARSTPKPRRSRHHRTTGIKTNKSLENNAPCIAASDASLHVSFESKEVDPRSVITVVERKLLRPCLV